MNWRVTGFSRRRDLDIGNARPVLRYGFMTGDDQTRRVKSLRRLLEKLRRRARRDQVKGGRRQRVLRAREEVTIRFLDANVERPDIGNANIGKARNAFARPAVRGWRQGFEDRFQIIQDRQDEVVAGPEETLQGAALGGLEQLCKAPVAIEESREGDAKQRVRLVGFAVDRPLRPALNGQPPAMPSDPEVGGEVDPRFGPGAVADP